MRGPKCIAAAVLVTALAGCRTGKPQPPGPPSAKNLPELVKTPNIYAAPSEGRWTLRLVSYLVGAFDQGAETPSPSDTTKSSPDEEERRTRLVAETTAQRLREKNIPAFILTRHVKRGRAAAERLPVFYVCVGAFDSPKNEDARAAREYFRKMIVRVGRERKRLFGHAEFVLLQTGLGGEADGVLRLYEIPAKARWGLVVGSFQGPKHKELAGEYALKLRAQGADPRIQQSDVASRLVAGVSEFKNDPKFSRLKRQFPRVEHNMLGYIAFRGKHENRNNEQRAQQALRDLERRGYDASIINAILRPPGTPPDVTVVESRVYVTRREGRNLTLKELGRAYRHLNPHAVRPAAFQSSVIDLRKGAWKARVPRPPIKPET